MPRDLYLSPGVHLAAVGADLVTLDVAADAYGCLPELGACVGPVGPGGHVEADDAAADHLFELGVLGCEPLADFQVPPSLPERSAWRTRTVRVDPSDYRRLALAYARAAPRLWRGSFRNLLRSASRERPTRALTNPDELARDAQAFDQLMPLTPLQGECLFRSRLLLSFLRTRGRDAQWVFGVRTRPFLAHCWLQAGDLVLDDAAERIVGYRPILVI